MLDQFDVAFQDKEDEGIVLLDVPINRDLSRSDNRSNFYLLVSNTVLLQSLSIISGGCYSTGIPFFSSFFHFFVLICHQRLSLHHIITSCDILTCSLHVPLSPPSPLLPSFHNNIQSPVVCCVLIKARYFRPSQRRNGK